MLLRKTIRKTKVFFHKTLQNFKSFFFTGYKKLPRSLSFNPLSRKSGKAMIYTGEQFYYEFYDEWQSDLNRLKKIDNNTIEMENAAACTGSFISPLKSIDEDTEKEKEKRSSQSGKGGAHILAERMKELEMMEAGDAEDVLDIEEALHYYSRLTSPVYLDIVDKFFMDMHSEFSAPPLSAPNT